MLMHIILGNAFLTEFNNNTSEPKMWLLFQVTAGK